jgi:insulysin
VSLTITTILLTGSVQPFATPHNTRRALSVAVGARFATPASLAENATVASPTAVIGKTTTSPKVPTKIIAQDHEFIKSDPDKRSYRAITLPNQLTALLVSDPTTDVEASSVHVRAGHFDDPPNRAGLAHFHEHMLFLGTEKYPKEEEYEEFLGSNGGMSNAYTDMEDTNYYFNVAPLDHDGEEKLQGGVSSALSGALDRFAQFFISPLFDESMLERELRAVNSEYLNGRTSDNWRNFQLLKHGSNKDHPFAKFGCGNYNTLTDGGVLKTKNGDDESVDTSDFGGGSSPREELVKFWTNKYHAGNLRLCVVGRASLDDLQELVEKTFGPVRPPPAGFIPNGIIDQIKAGILKTSSEEGSHLRDQNGDLIFQTEHMLYSPNVAFGPEQLGLIREVVPLIEARTIKIFSAVPPLDDPILSESRPFSVMSHLVGHESPGSLHHLLVEEGWINSLSSGVGISSSDFCLVNIAIALTPKGMRERDQVLAKTWQWLSLIKDAVGNDDHGLIEQYHNELNRISEIGFKFREMSDPTDFCSAAAEKLFDYEPSKLLLGSSETKKYDAEVTRAFLSRITPQNSLIVVTAPELEMEELESSSASARGKSWETEERYGAKYRQVRISDELLREWNHPTEIDARLRLPALNEFIPEDLSLRCDDEDSLKSFNPDVDYRKQQPDLIIDTPKLRMWHKMDRVFRVPKASIRLQLASPNLYRSPRSMTLNRIFQAVLKEDLNSFVYDASVAGCNYGISCVPSAYRLSVSGYSEKLPHLLDVVTSRIETLIAEMKEGEEAHPALARTFDKAKENLLRRTKNYVYDSPYETGSYNLRTVSELIDPCS